MRRFLLLSLLASTAAIAQVSGPLVMTPDARGVSPALAEIASLGAATAFAVTEFRIRHSHEIGKSQAPSAAEAAVSGATEPRFAALPSTPYMQTATYQPMGAPIGTNFEALGVGTPSFVIVGAPPDTTLGVSDTQIVQWVNSHIAIYNKAGTALLPAPGFIPGNAIWSGLPAGSLCKDFNRGDPLVQYDRMAEAAHDKPAWRVARSAHSGSNAVRARGKLAKDKPPERVCHLPPGWPTGRRGAR